jgi:hypothetical protein
MNSYAVATNHATAVKQTPKKANPISMSKPIMDASLKEFIAHSYHRESSPSAMCRMSQNCRLLTAIQAEGVSAPEEPESRPRGESSVAFNASANGIDTWSAGRLFDAA